MDGYRRYDGVPGGNEPSRYPGERPRTRHRPGRQLSSLQRYGLAVFSVGLALGAALLLDRFHFRDAAVPLLLFAGALTSWYGGTGWALLAVRLSVISFDSYLLKSMAPKELLDTIRQVHNGKKRVPPEVAARLAEHFSDDALTTPE